MYCFLELKNHCAYVLLEGDRMVNRVCRGKCSFFRSVVFSVDFDGVICLDGVRLDGLRQS